MNEKLLDAFIDQINAQAAMGDPEADPITYLQAASIAQLLNPSINREEYMQLRQFATQGAYGSSPTLSKGLAKILSKLLDDVPVAPE